MPKSTWNNSEAARTNGLLCRLLAPLLGPAARKEGIGMLDAMTVLRAINVITGMMRMPVTKEMLMDLNAQLNKIPVA